MFISVAFNAGDVRTYTYRYTGAATPEPGDYALAPVKGSIKLVHVLGIDVPEPHFECKEIDTILIEKPAAAASE